jgi:phospholipid/cholesterol/gamma-HCH transport system permease protein
VTLTGSPKPESIVARLGRSVLTVLAYVGALALMCAGVLRGLVRGLTRKREKLRVGAIGDQLVRAGVRSLGIVVLVQVFLGVILALQLTPPLRDPWQQQAQVSRIIGVAGFRMLGPIITAVVLTGFAGASIAAELGTMVVSEEIEALESMALRPLRYLVLPRVVASVIAMILLTVVANVMIALGGYLTSWLVLGPESYVGYFERMRDQLQYLDLTTGLIMASVFGLLISLIACHEGLSVRGGAEGVGRATTMTVVYSIVSIILAAAMFTVIFYVLGW